MSAETPVLTGWGEQTGLLVAAAVAPGTFERSLVGRSLKDQGAVTGLATTLSYVLTVTAQSTIEAAASLIAPALPGSTEAHQQRNATLLLDIAVIPLGVLAQRALPRRNNEAIALGLTRQLAWRTTATATGAVVFAGVEIGAHGLDRALGAGGRISRVPLAIPAGLALAAVIERRRRSSLPDEQPDDDWAGLSPYQAVGAGLGTAVGLSVVAFAEHELAHAIGAGLAAALPGTARLYRPVGHAGGARWPRRCGHGAVPEGGQQARGRLDRHRAWLRRGAAPSTGSARPSAVGRAAWCPGTRWAARGGGTPTPTSGRTPHRSGPVACPTCPSTR